MKSKDFVKEDIISDVAEMHTDHEVQMAREECYYSAQNAIALHKLLKHVSEQQGLEGWVSEKITLANDYLKTVREHLEYSLMSSSDEQAVATPESTVTGVMEDASAGCSSSGTVATVSTSLGGKPGTGKPKKVGNMIKRTKPAIGKGVY